MFGTVLPPHLPERTRPIGARTENEVFLGVNGPRVEGALMRGVTAAGRLLGAYASMELRCRDS
jgi:hypothetical protein